MAGEGGCFIRIKRDVPRTSVHRTLRLGWRILSVAGMVRVRIRAGALFVRWLVGVVFYRLLTVLITLGDLEPQSNHAKYTTLIKYSKGLYHSFTMDTGRKTPDMAQETK